MAGKILVLGSSNTDLIIRIPRFHQPGETIQGKSLIPVFGVKGANQAIAAKRLGGEVVFITKLGNDFYGEGYRRYLVNNGLDPRGILTDSKEPTGIALIELNQKGENRIIVSPGANGSLLQRDLKRLGPLWKGTSVFVTQLEIPIRSVESGLEMARRRKAITLLNPSPPVKLSSRILSLVDYLVPNEWEAEFLTEVKIVRDEDIRKAARKLLEMGSQNVVITLGSKGLFFKNKDEEIRVKAFKVKVVDTTAAGDAFMGAMACGLLEGGPIEKVLRFATGAAGLAVTKLGAQPSLPSRRDLDRFMAGTS